MSCYDVKVAKETGARGAYARIMEEATRALNVAADDLERLVQRGRKRARSHYEPVMARPPSPVIASPQPSELEAERQRVLELDLARIPREQIGDHDAFDRLKMLRFCAPNLRAFEDYYRQLADRFGDERGWGVVANLWDHATRRLSLPTA